MQELSIGSLDGICFFKLCVYVHARMHIRYICVYMCMYMLTYGPLPACRHQQTPSVIDLCLSLCLKRAFMSCRHQACWP